MVNKSINVNVKTKGVDEATEEFKDLGKATEVANDSLEGLNKTFEEANGDIQPLTARMGEAEDRLYELALAGDTTSREYQGLLEKVGQYRKVQIQTDLVVDSAATTLDQKLGGALTGATSGFAAIQGVMGLVGVESEALEETLLKVQSALAIQQGVQGIRESIPVFKQFGGVAIKAFKGMTTASKAFALTGIGVVLTAVAALMIALEKLEEQEKKAEEARQKRHDAEMLRYQDELASRRKQLDELNKLEDNEAAAREQRIKVLQAQGKSSAQAERQVALEFMESIQKRGKATQEAYRKITEENKELFKQFNSETMAFGLDPTKAQKIEEKRLKKILDAKIAANKKEQLLLVEQIKGLRKIQSDGFDKMEILDAQHEKTKYENWKKFQDKRLSVARQIEDLEIEIMEEGINQELKLNKVKFDRLIEDTKKNTEINALERKRLIELFLFQQQEAENDIRNEFRQKDLEAEKEFGVESINVAELTANKEVETTFNKYAAMGKITMQFYEDEEKQRKEDREKVFEGIEEGLEMAEKGAAAVQALGDAVFANKMSKLEKGSKEEEALAKKQFKFNKALQLGGAIIDAGKAITASLAQSPVAIGPVPNPAGIASLAFAAATSAANIATIAATKFESPGGTVDNPSPSGIGGGGAPEFNVVGDSGVNQLAQLQQQPTQAFVVSGDVTTAQALDRNRVQNATL